MKLVRILIGEEHFSVYRSVTESESQMLRALLGADFHFELEEGEPMDDLLFDVLSGVGMQSDLFLARPANASLLGTFEIKDAAAPSAGMAEGRAAQPALPRWFH